MTIRRSHAFSLLALAAALCPQGSEAADKYNSTPPPRQTYSAPPARTSYNSSANQSRSYSTGTPRQNTFNNRATVAPRQSAVNPRPVGTPSSSLTATQKARVSNITRSGANQGVMGSRLTSAAGTKPTMAGTKAPLDTAHAKAMNSRLSTLNSRLNAQPNLKTATPKPPDPAHTQNAAAATQKARTDRLARLAASNPTRTTQVAGKGPVQTNVNAKKAFTDAHDNKTTTEKTKTPPAINNPNLHPH